MKHLALVQCPPPSGGSSGGGNNDGGNNGGGGDGNTTEVSSPGDTIATVTIQAGLRDFTASKQKISILDQHVSLWPITGETHLYASYELLPLCVPSPSHSARPTPPIVSASPTAHPAVEIASSIPPARYVAATRLRL